MILIGIELYCITSIHRHYYILPLNYCKNNTAMLFLQWGGGEGDVAPHQISGEEIFVRGRNYPKKGLPHEEKIAKIKAPPW